MSNEQNGGTLTKETREKVLAALRTACYPQGTVDMRELPKRLFDAGIFWSTLTGGKKLDEWLAANFPEIEISEGKGRLLPAGYPPVPEEVREKVRQLAEADLSDDGTVLLAYFGGVLRQNGIDRRMYSTQSLAEWVISLLPELKKSPDGQYLLRKDEQPLPPANAEGVYPPAFQRLADCDQEELIRQMHAIAFMGWWNNNTKLLRRYTGCTGNDPQVWSAMVACHLNDVLQGKAPCIRAFLEDGTLRVAFFSGMHTAIGEPLYCVLKENTREEGTRYQPMIMEGISYPGEAESELGAWLKEHVENVMPRKREADENVTMLLEVCEFLEQRREELLAMEEDYLESIRQGRNLSIPCWTAVSHYRKKWNRAQQLLTALELTEELTTLEEIRRWCEERNRLDRDLKKVRELVGELRAMILETARQSQPAAAEAAQEEPGLEEACKAFEESGSAEELYKLLEPYVTVLDCMDPEKAGPALIAAMQPVSVKFGFNCMIFMGQKLWNVEFYEEYRKKLRETELKVANLEALCAVQEPDQPEQKVMPKAEQLLTELCQRKYSAVWGAFGGRDLLENLVLEDRINEALDLAANEESMLEMGYDAESRSRILENLENREELKAGQSLLHMGCRLLTVFGNRNETAERYLLAGLMADAPNCAAKLLELYRTRGQEEEFCTLWGAYGAEAAYDLDNQLYYAQILAGKAPDALGTYLQEHPWLMHLEDATYELRRALETAGDRMLLSQLELYTSRMAGVDALNPLEEAVIQDRMEQVQELADAPERLMAMGYDQEDIARISRGLLEDNRPVGSDPYQVAMRLELFQGNRNKRAESWLWQSLAQEDNPVRAGSLIRILAREERWTECIQLYDHYGEAAGRQTEPRRAWLTALLHRQPEEVALLSRTLLQDVLYLLVQAPEAAKVAEEALDNLEQEQAQVFRYLLQLKEVLTRDYVRSVVLHDSGLRDLLTDPEALSKMGFSDEQIRKARTLYQTGSYAKGGDCLSVARRVAGLVGLDSPEAEQFCRFALPDPEAVNLLWDIYEETENRQQQWQLLQTYPTLRQQRPVEYGDGLFRTEQYELFLDWVEQQEWTQQQQLQVAVARVATGAEPGMELPAVLCDGEVAVQVARILARKGRLDLLENWIFGVFRQLLQQCSPERLERIMTADGTLDAEGMAQIQSHALEQTELYPAVYYYNILGVGQIEDRAREFYDRMLQDGTGDEEHYAKMELLGKLYPAHREELEIRRRVLGLQDLLNRKPVPEGLAEKVAQTLEECAAEPAVLRTLLNQVAASPCGTAPAVIRSIRALAQREALQTDGLMYLHGVAAQQSKRAILEEELQEALCEAYLRAMNRDSLPVEVAQDASEICRRILRGDRSNHQVAYCLYRLQELLGKTREAAYALRYLVGCSDEELGEKLSALVSVAVEQLPGELPDVTELFLQTLEECDPEQIVEFCKFCGSFGEVAEEDLSAAHMKLLELRSLAKQGGDEQYGTLNRTESLAMIRALLSAPDTEAYWEGCLALPEISDLATARLMYCRAMKNPEQWGSCVRYCAKNRVDEMTVRALWNWVQATKGTSKGSRTFAAQMAMENPGYFARWTGEEEVRMLLETLKLLCAGAKAMTRIHDNNAAHTALSTASYMAVSMGSREALQIMEEEFLEFLTTTNTEVGAATVIRLLYMGRIPEARYFLAHLLQTDAPVAADALMRQLSGLSDEELQQWVEKPENRLMMELFLEDGNRPAAQDIQKLTGRMILEGKADLCARMLLELLKVYPQDYVFNDALFILCKCGVEDPLPILHRALRGLLVPLAQSATYYRRDSEWCAYCLAGVNAVIIAKNLELKVSQVSPGYDFSVAAGDYLRRMKPDTIFEKAAKINDYQKNLLAKLANQVPGELELLCKGILSMVTADWSDLMQFFYDNDGYDGPMIRRYMDVAAVKNYADGQMESLGLCRSLLRVVEGQPANAARAFLDKLQKAYPVTYRGNNREYSEHVKKSRQILFARQFHQMNILQKAELPLMYPLEEYSLFHDLYRDKIEACRSTDQNLMFYRLWVVGAMQDHGKILQHQYFSAAQKAFREGFEGVARAYYDALQKLADAGLFCSNIKLDTNIVKAQYKAYGRLCGLLSGDGDMIEGVASPDYQPWRCINMVMTVMSSPRAEIAMQISMFFTGEIRKLAQALVRGVNPAIPEQEKMDALRDMEWGLPKAYLALMMRQRNRLGANSFHIKDPNFLEEIERTHIETASADYAKSHFRMETSVSYRSLHILILRFDWIQGGALRQLPVKEEVELEALVAEVTAEPLEEALPVLPEFAREVERAAVREDMEALQRQWKALPRFKQNLARRLELSRSIYSGCKDRGQNSEELAAVIRFCLDFYAYHNDLGTPEDLQTARKAVLELAVYQERMKRRLGAEATRGVLREAIGELETMVKNLILFNILQKGYTAIQQVAEDFFANREAYDILGRMLHDDVYRYRTVQTVYKVLDQLMLCFNRSGDNQTMLRQGYVEARNLAGTISYGMWQPLKDTLCGLIQKEIQELDRRPQLRVKILNRGKQWRDEFLYGEISNEGNVAARNLTIYAVYENSATEYWVLSGPLEPKARCSFKLPYRAEAETKKLHYELKGWYSYEGHEEYANLPDIQGELELSDYTEQDFPTRVYNTQTIVDFQPDGNGDVVSEGFFGRKRETRDLRNLFRSGRFASFQNAVVYGIRRAGKTTLLNYVRAYVKAYYSEEAIITIVGCLKDSGSHPVYSLFVEQVLDHIRLEYPEFCKNEQWHDFCSKWVLAEGEEDLAPQKLEMFFRELKNMTGKGLVLMLDEVDNFFASVEQRTSVDSHLFQVLSNMLCSASCQEALHLILCGSKYLLRYRTGDGGISQFFQRIGDVVIEVGLITKEEVRALLQKPYEAHPEVIFTEEAIDWIWEYTQGLVWHVKLLANTVTNYVRDHGRSVIYPVDVQSQIMNLIQKEYCEQFFDGVGEQDKDKDERLVLDVMQRLSPYRGSSVPAGKLETLLTSPKLPEGYRMTKSQVDKALGNLLKLKLLAFSEADQSYRFPVELYRLYFRTQTDFPSVFGNKGETDPIFIRKREN